MSYYESNYYQNPGPHYGTSDKDEPVPGWGLLPRIAGPKMVGVGAPMIDTGITKGTLTGGVTGGGIVTQVKSKEEERTDGLLARYGGWVAFGVLTGTVTAYYMHRKRRG